MVLPAALAGDVLIERLPAEAVLAEVHKVAGDDLDVAVPAGTYRVLVRSAAVMQRCPVTVPHGGAIAVDLAGCDEIALADTVAKGGDAATPIRNRWAIELGAGLAGARRDAFTRRLEDAFDYSGGALRSQLSVELVRRMTPNLALTGRVTRIASEHYSYATDLEPLGYDVTSNVFTVGGRGELSFHDDHTLLFAEAGLGLTWARDRFEDEMDRVFSDDFFAPHLAGAVGVVRYSPWLNGVGMGLEARWLYAPTVTNELDDPDTMDVGGLFFGLTVDYRP